MATDKIVAEYTVKVDEALKNLDKLAARVNKIDDERKKAQAGFKGMASSLASSFSKVGAAIGLAFSTQQLVSFGKEAVQLAAKAEGVERAFKRIGSQGLLNDLRKATRGTVSDLELMQRAVQASNFKLPLDQLAALLKFASARARETGEDVDYLVNSIVLGIGRKSPLILDNLGISAVELRERLKGVGVEATSVADIAKIVGDIATEELEKMGHQADTSADRIAQIGVAFENMQVKAGKAINDVANQLIKLGEKQGIIESDTPFRKQIELTVEYATAVRNAAVEIKKDRESEIRALEQVNDKDAAIQKLKEDRIRLLKELETELANITSTETRKSENLKLLFAEKALENAVGLDVFQRGAAKERIKEANEEIKANVIKEGVLKSQISALIKILGLQKDGGEETNKSVVSIALLTSQLTDLKKELSNAEVGSSSFFRILDKVTAKTKELNEAIALTKLDDALKVDTEESIEAFGQVIGATDSLNATVTDIFGGAGSAMVEAYWDTFLQNSLDALETTEDRTKSLMELEELRRQENRDFFDTTLMAWQSLTNTVAALVEAQYQRQYNALDQSLKKEQITREQYDKRKSQLGREQAKKQKEFAIVQAVINTALGVTNAFATAPNIILGAVLAAVVAAAGAAEIATISSQPLPQFAEGGWVDSKGLIHGRSHRQGGVKIEAEGNEYITKGKYAKPNAEILEAINTGNWERYKMENIITPAIEQVLSGGMENMGASYMLQNQFNDRNILRGLDRNRTSEKNGFIYLGDRIERALLSKGNDRYA
jgi:hypothetical protein